MQDLAQWLEKLGMSEYAQRIAENDIDIDVLSQLSADGAGRIRRWNGVEVNAYRNSIAAVC